ncbi:MAG: HRDC domain-containing protein [Bacteroidales bacterium]|nr:HRDC domain-containing protein [Bacteroidales bacterium]
MQIKFFTIPINAIADQTSSLNSFLSNNKIIEFEKHLVQTPQGASWCIYISYEAKKTTFQKSNSNEKIDYKKKLSQKEFEYFEKLREIRKEIAKQDAVSAFVVATNAELAEIVKIENLTLEKLKNIEGFGDKKVEKYGKLFIEKLK